MPRYADGPKMGTQNTFPGRGAFAGKAYPNPSPPYEGESPESGFLPGRVERKKRKRKPKKGKTK